MKLDIRRLGRTRYEAAHALQQQLVARRVEGLVGDTLLITEHEPVVTRGRKSPPGDTAGVAIPVVTVERGGEATYHGPGQIVGYPILLLSEGRRDLHRHLRDLEEVVIRTLSDFGIVGRRVEGYTGVWIGERKVCSLGVAVRRWVTWHGFALNVAADLSAFGAFHPCGLDPRVMTNVQDHVTAGAPGVLERKDGPLARSARSTSGADLQAALEARLVEHFVAVFGFTGATDVAPGA